MREERAHPDDFDLLSDVARARGRHPSRPASRRTSRAQKSTPSRSMSHAISVASGKAARSTRITRRARRAGRGSPPVRPHARPRHRRADQRDARKSPPAGTGRAVRRTSCRPVRSWCRPRRIRPQHRDQLARRQHVAGAERAHVTPVLHHGDDDARVVRAHRLIELVPGRGNAVPADDLPALVCSRSAPWRSRARRPTSSARRRTCRPPQSPGPIPFRPGACARRPPAACRPPPPSGHRGSSRRAR